MDSPRDPATAAADGSRGGDLSVTAALSELRTLAAMLAAEARQHAQQQGTAAAADSTDGAATPARTTLSAHATPSKATPASAAKKKAAAAAVSSIVPPSAVPASSLRPFHAQMIAFIAPFLDAASLPQLAEEMAAVASAPSTATGTADACDPMSPLYAQIDARRWALKCVAHLAGHTSAPASASMVLGASNAPPSLPSPAFVLLFPLIVSSLDFFLRGSLGAPETRPQNWMGLMSNALAALAAMVDDVVRAMAVAPASAAAVASADGWITAEQTTELNNSLVLLLGLLHKTMAWGTNMLAAPVSASATVGQLAQTVQAAIKPAPAAAAATAAEAPSDRSSSGAPPPSAPIAIPIPAAALQRSGSKDALTPRSVIARPSLSPPALSPNDPSGAAGARFISNTGSLFSPASSFALLSNEHWMQLQNQYTANAAALAAAAAASSSIDPRLPHDPLGSSGWASSANDSENEVDHHHSSHAHGTPGSALKYESRVRGARPMRPSAVNAALASGKHSRSTSSASLTGAAAAAASAASAADSAAARRQAHALSAEKVRTHSLHCLLSLSRGAPRLFHATHWASFVPQDSAAALAARPLGGPSLVSIVLLDPATRVRSLAAQALGALLVDSPLTKWSGAMSSDAGASATATAAGAPRIRKNRENAAAGAGASGGASGASSKDLKGSAFTSLSVRMADTLRALHTGLLEALKRETNPGVVQHVLKTLTVLVANTPYKTLSHSSTSSSIAKSGSTAAAAAAADSCVLVPIVVHLLTHMLHEPSSYHTVSTSHSSAAAVAAAAAALMPSASSSRFPSSATTRGVSTTATALPSIPSSTAGSASAQASKSDLRHAIFSTLGAIFDASLTSLPEMRALLLPSPASTSAAGFHLDIVPLLIAHARSRQKADPTPDAYSLLAKLARMHPASLAPWWKWSSTGGGAAATGASISALIKDCLTGSTDVPTKLLALKILEEWTKGSSGGSSSSAETDGDSASGGGGDDDEKEGGNYEPLLLSGVEGFFNLEGSRDMFAQQLVQLYTSLLPPPASVAAPALTPQELHMSKQAATAAASVRARILMCLSLIPFVSWCSLAPHQRQVLRRLTMEAATDAVNAVKTNACRALCLYSLYASREVTKEEVLAANAADASAVAAAASPESVLLAAASSPLVFVRRSVELLLGLVDSATSPVVTVRLKAAWALANLADFGGSAGASGDAASPASLALHDLLPPALYARFVSTLLQSASDNEKILSNVVRGVGNLARWFPLSAADAAAVPADAGSSSSTAIFLRMLSSLLSSLSTCKTSKSKWNCCHALGQLFGNAELPSLWSRDAAAATQACMAWGKICEVLRDAPTNVDASSASSSSKAASSAAAAVVPVSSQHSNFKVRISAASALGAPPSLAHYGRLASFTLVVSTLLDLARSLLLSSASADAEHSTFKDFKYLAALRLQILQTVCVVLGRYDGSGGGDSDPAATETVALLSLYRTHASFLPKLILAERLRWEKESKLIARVERAAAQQAQAQQQAQSAGAASSSRLKSKSSSSLSKPSPPLVAPPPPAAGAMSKAAVEQAQAIVERAASSIESVFRVIETQDPAAASAHMAARFAAEANGEAVASNGSDGMGASSPPRMLH